MFWENPSFNVFFTEKNTHTLVCQSWFTLTNVSFSSYCISCYTGWPKKRPISFFIPKSCFTFFFSIFFRWCRQQAWEIILTPIWIQLDDLLRSNRQPAIIEAYFATKSVLLTVAMQERFWQGQCTWQKDSSKFGGQISGDRKCSRCPTKSTVVNIVQIVQIQQARVIFNPLTDIFTKWCLVLIYFDQLASARSEFCKEIA